MRERYLGLELSGAKNLKTALSILEYYPREKKVFLLDIRDRIGAEKADSRESSRAARTMASTDAALLQALEETDEDYHCLAVNVPLTLPPFFLEPKVGRAAASWMSRFSKKRLRSATSASIDFTTYTQRPVELWIRHEVLASLPRPSQFEVDEALGGNRAPLTARMQFLQRHLDRKRLLEVWPKLSAIRLCESLGIDRRFLSRYRKLEEGAHARLGFLEQLISQRGVFIYERDLRKLSQSLAAFDSFLCAYTALASKLGECEKPPRGFPVASGWVEFPQSPRSR